MPTSSADRNHRERSRPTHVQVRNLQRDRDGARELQSVFGQQPKERRGALGRPVRDAVVGLETAVEVGCALLDVSNAAAALQRSQRPQHEPDRNRGERDEQHDARAVHDLRIEGASNTEVDGDQRDHQRSAREQGRTARDDQRLQALAELA